MHDVRNSLEHYLLGSLGQKGPVLWIYKVYVPLSISIPGPPGYKVHHERKSRLALFDNSRPQYRISLLYSCRQVHGFAKARANECNILRQMLGTACCVRLYTMLGYVASSMKSVKLFAQHMPTFILFSWPVNQVVSFPNEVIVLYN